jgi:hypothetical protein
VITRSSAVCCPALRCSAGRCAVIRYSAAPLSVASCLVVCCSGVVFATSRTCKSRCPLSPKSRSGRCGSATEMLSAPHHFAHPGKISSMLLSSAVGASEDSPLRKGWEIFKNNRERRRCDTLVLSPFWTKGQFKTPFALCYVNSGIMRKELKFGGVATWSGDPHSYASSTSSRPSASGLDSPLITNHYSRIAAFLIDTPAIRNALKPCSCIIASHSNRHSSRGARCCHREPELSTTPSLSRTPPWRIIRPIGRVRI